MDFLDLQHLYVFWTAGLTTDICEPRLVDKHSAGEIQLRQTHLAIGQNILDQ
jgi:hypothetical protein